MIQLRDYQLKLVNDIRREFSFGRQRIVAVAPTGAGKTVTFSYIAQSCMSKGTRLMALVHRAELVEQISDTFQGFGVKHGIVTAGRSISYEPIQVASVQTLIRRLDKVPMPDLIIVDEGHHLTANNMWGQVINYWKPSKLIGFTATPCRLDSTGLGVSSGGFYETIVEGPPVRWLIDRGHLSKYKVFMPPSKIDLSGVSKRAGDFAKNELENRVNKSSITGDAVEQYLRYARHKKGIVFCVSVAHSEAVAADFRASGINAVALNGSTPKEKRKAILEDYRQGRIQVLTNCELFTEGFDLGKGTIDAISLLRPTHSLSLWKQMIGRALRPAPGKDFATILDHVAGTITHGLPDEEPEWSLYGPPKKNKRLTITGAEPLPIRTCPKCFTPHRSDSVCPNCGHVYTSKERTVEVQEGELKELGEADKEKLKKLRRRELGNAKTLEQLLVVAKERGYREAWAYHVFNSRRAKEGLPPVTGIVK